MSVAPDLLLQSSPSTKSVKAQSNRPPMPAEPARGRDENFAQVYANERKAKVSEAKERVVPEDSSRAQTTVSAPADEPEVAESGKNLPSESIAQEALTEDSSVEAALDPLLMLGMNLQGTEVETAEQVVGAEVDVLTEATDADTDVTSVPPALNQGPVLSSTLPGKLGQIGQNPVAVAAQDMSVMAGQSNVMALSGKGMTVAERATEKNADVKNPVLNPSAVLTKSTDAPVSDPALAAARLVEADVLIPEGQIELSAEMRPESFAGKLSQLSQAISQQTAQAARLPLVPGQPLAMNQPGWSEAAVDRVMWLSSQNLKSAEIQLDPANLGRMEVRIQMTQEQTQVTFSSPHAHVREALESQAHRLRELFAQQGMNLLDVNVSDQSLARGWQGQGGESSGQRGRHSVDDSLQMDSEVHRGVVDLGRSAASAGRGLVDYYA